MNTDPSSDDPGDAGHGTAASRDASPANTAASTPDDVGTAEPMSLSLLGRLFGIPFVIIGVIVGGAVIVVFAFGAPTAQRDRPIGDLLTSLESGAGGKSLGMLMPRDKQHWQTGLELTMRLEKKGEFSDAQLKEVAERLGAMVQAEIVPPAFPAASKEGPSPAEKAYRQRMEFLIRALGKTGRPEAIQPLANLVQRGDEPFAMLAMAELGNSAAVPGIRRVIPLMVRRLESAKSPEAFIVGCTALSVLAGSSDTEVVDLLTRVLRSHEGEVAWSAALALARLGNQAGKSALLDLLDRSFWETGKRYQVREADGSVKRYAMPADRIDQYLIAAIDAASHVADPDIWRQIGVLQYDLQPCVRAKAEEVLASRKGAVDSVTESER